MNLPHHMRIAALQCNFEGGKEATLKVPALWRDFGCNVEQLLHTHSELYTAVFQKEKHGELLREYLARCHACGIQVILYMNCHIIPPSDNERAEEWSLRSRNGEYVKFYDTYYGCCVNSSWADHFEAALADLREFDLRGVFFDGPAWEACFCPRCDARFRAAHGKTIADGSGHELAAFTMRTRLDFVGRMYRRVKTLHPGWVSYLNLALMHSRASVAEMEELLSYNDLVGTEGGFQFYGPPRNVAVWRCGMHAKLAEAVAKGKPTVIFMAGDHKPWSWYLHTPAETRLCYASALGNGASVWYGIHCSADHLASAAGAAARDMVQFDRMQAALYERTESGADIGILYSFDTAKHYRATGEKTDFYSSSGAAPTGVIGDYTASFQGAYAAMFRSGLPFDIVTDLSLDHLSRYKVLLLPTAACMGPKALEAIRGFVRAGGVILADSETSLYDQSLTRRPDLGLADVLGVNVRGVRKYQTHDYFAFSPHHALFAEEGVGELPAPRMALDISLGEGAEVLAHLYPPLAGRYSGRPLQAEFPFIVRNAYGAGHAYYFAGTFFELYGEFGIVHYRRIVTEIVRKHSRPLIELLHAPESVEFTVRKERASGCVVAHLVNYSGGMTRPIEAVIPLQGLALRCGVHSLRARALVVGKDLEIGRDGIIALPTLKEFEVVEIRV